LRFRASPPRTAASPEPGRSTRIPPTKGAPGRASTHFAGAPPGITGPGSRRGHSHNSLFTRQSTTRPRPGGGAWWR